MKRPTANERQAHARVAEQRNKSLHLLTCIPIEPSSLCLGEYAADQGMPLAEAIVHAKRLEGAMNMPVKLNRQTKQVTIDRVRRHIAEGVALAWMNREES